MKNKYLLIILLAALLPYAASAQRWTPTQANTWYQNQAWLVGANYTPAYAINQLEFWQAETFDPNAINQEFSWAENLGLNCMRVFLHHALWVQDKSGFQSRIDTFLSIAAKHHIKIIFVLFDDCWTATWHLGKQPEPKPGIHNSGWLQDPGNHIPMDTLETYSKDLIGHFKHDKRILLWDLYNEPGQIGRNAKSLPLLQNVFAWARSVNPDQPLSSGIYDDEDKSLTLFQLANSDVMTYHNYEPEKYHQWRIDSLRKAGENRPLICTEYMARKRGSTFQAILPLLKKEHVGAINWGFVDGKTQTKYAWDEKNWGNKDPQLWFHEILRKDGAAYNDKEANLIWLLTHHNNDSPLASANWITTNNTEPKKNRPALIFKKDFAAGQAIARARLYITAHGLYEAQLNGKRVGDAYFTPGYTDYHKRLQYQVYDILPKAGKNQLTVTVGDGYYRGDYGGGLNRYGNDASVIARLEIHYQNGKTQIIRSDSTWQCTTGPIQSASIYHGELYDANSQPKDWGPVKTLDLIKETLSPTIGKPVKKHEVFAAKRLIKTDILDFGQNIAGWVRFCVKGKKGDTIRIYHAEELAKDSSLWTKPLRDAKATDTYVLSGNGVETFEPHFTYHGFRYIQIKGCKVIPANYQAIALYTDLKRTGTFSCSNSKLNQLQSNIEWSMKGNFFDIPTDCPQRSERLGWTEDADVFAPTAAFLYDVKDFYHKWLTDLANEQHPNGNVPCTIPYTAWDGGVAAWSDAAFFTPWRIYQAYGDLSALKSQYPSMKGWADYVKTISPNYLWKSGGFGDWYPAGPKTDIAYLDQCYWYHSTDIVLQTARLLQQSEDAAKYQRQSDSIRAAFNRTYLNHIPQTQTAYVVGLHFGLLPDSAVKTLVKLIHENNDHLATGFMGTPYLLHVLTKYGYSDLAYKVLLQEDVPSWLYMVNSGATTMWEKWNAISPDGTKLEDVSFNHYAFGSVGQWLYENIAGIQAASPGYQQIRIAPRIGGGLTWAKGSYTSRYGLIRSAWTRSGHQYTLQVTIPKGTTATIIAPGKTPRQVKSGNYTIKGNI